VIAKAPSAGLWDGQTDEAEIGVTYDVLDRVLAGGEHDEPLEPGTMERISALVTASEHKRLAIPVFRRNSVDVMSTQ
jgi:NAD+ synthase